MKRERQAACILRENATCSSAQRVCNVPGCNAGFTRHIGASFRVPRMLGKGENSARVVLVVPDKGGRYAPPGARAAGFTLRSPLSTGGCAHLCSAELLSRDGSTTRRQQCVLSPWRAALLWSKRSTKFPLRIHERRAGAASRLLSNAQGRTPCQQLCIATEACIKAPSSNDLNPR